MNSFKEFKFLTNNFLNQGDQKVSILVVMDIYITEIKEEIKFRLDVEECYGW